MTKTKEHAVSRRTFVKGSALAGLGAAALGTGTLFACSPQGTDEVSGGASETVDEKVVWGHCSVNCEGRCALRLHVTNDEVAWWRATTRAMTCTAIIRFAHVCAVVPSGVGLIIPTACLTL